MHLVVSASAMDYPQFVGQHTSVGVVCAVSWAEPRAGMQGGSVPLYEFRCAQCGPVERSFPMSDVPEHITCPRCDAASPRRITGAALHGSSPAKRLIESTESSAHEPDVVSSLPPARSAASPRKISRNPLHQKLPRPE